MKFGIEFLVKFALELLVQLLLGLVQVELLYIGFVTGGDGRQ